MESEIKKDIGNTNGAYQKKWRAEHPHFYAYLRQKKEGKTTKNYEEWLREYEPYKR